MQNFVKNHLTKPLSSWKYDKTTVNLYNIQLYLTIFVYTWIKGCQMKVYIERNQP